jgi:aminoglycoside/choline kinase family phosphotransferase
LFKEAKLFSDWYTKKNISKKKLQPLNIEINKQIKFLISNLNLKNDTLVHRDFHVSNLMKYKEKLATIDTQDALIGNRAYDLASLIDDVRLKTSYNLKEMIYQNYLYLNKKKINEIKFKNDFEILSVLRNLKVIGIFTRLAVRDGKRKYLKLIPHARKLIENRVNNNDIFKDLRKNLEDNFPKKN